MKRRAFITLLGGAVAAWPVAVRAQQGERMRRIGNLMNVSANDPEASERLVALAQRLQELGWIDGRNVRIDTRWAGAEADHATHFLMKTLPKVATEMALHVLAYNLTRVMNIMGIQPLVAVMRA